MKKLSLISLLLLFSCTPLEFFDIANDYVESTDDCPNATYQTEYQELGIYRDNKNNSYKTLIDYQKIEDRFFNSLSAKDAAQIASIAIDTYKENDKESYQEIYDKKFNNFHVIITNEDDEFYYLYNPKKFETNKEELISEIKSAVAFVRVKKLCWDENDVNFTIIFRQGYFVPLILIHELGHIYSYYEYGSSDRNHENPKIWFRLSGYDSMNGKILLNYEKITGLKVDTNY